MKMPIGFNRENASKNNEFSIFPIAIVLGAQEAEHKTGWVKERQLHQSKDIFACILAMVKNDHGFSLSCFIISFKLCAWKKRNRILKGGQREKTTKR